MCESSGETSAVVEALEGLFLIQPFGMPLWKDKQSHLSQQAAAHLGGELFSFRGKNSLIFESCFLPAVLYNQLFEGMEMLFEHTFVERRIVKIWRNSWVETFMLELWFCSNSSWFLQLSLEWIYDSIAESYALSFVLVILSAGLYLWTNWWYTDSIILGFTARLETVLKPKKISHNKGNWKVKSCVFTNMLAESDCFDQHVSVECGLFVPLP